MIYANCEVYYNDAGDLGVLTRTSPYHSSDDGFLEDATHPAEDISINLDRRLIEFYLSKPNGASYKEWDKLMEECGYSSLFQQDFGENLKYVQDKVEYEEVMSHMSEVVEGFFLNWVPSGKIFHIVTLDDRDQYGEFNGFYQDVEWFDVSDFMESSPEVLKS